MRGWCAAGRWTASCAAPCWCRARRAWDSAGASLAGWATLPVLLAGFFLFIAALGCILPNASAMSLAHSGHRAGTASALMGTLQFRWERWRAPRSACGMTARRCRWRW